MTTDPYQVEQGGVQLLSMVMWFSPAAAIGSPRWRPCFLPAGGHGFSPCGGVRGRDVAEAVGRSGIVTAARL